MSNVKPLGPVITAVAGLELDATDRDRLRHPNVGGVTLFARNFASREQVSALCREIRALRDPHLLICVDHEGGRVQRFKDGFTLLPPMRRIGALADHDAAHALDVAKAAGFIMGAELKACGVDVSVAPVLDLDYGASTIIGDRAFHADPHQVARLAGALLDGMNDAGMVGVGKHFPGHGYIAADSHLELPVDERSWTQIETRDLVPFMSLASRLAGVMPAHVLYPAIDTRPAGFSRFWLQEVLRRQCGFEGAIFSDDLGMLGAAGEGSFGARASAAFEAGCDLVLACTPADADALLGEPFDEPTGPWALRLARMFGLPTGLVSADDRERRLENARCTLSCLPA
jgi:beta-N-acetylhexosaminidase